VDNPFFPRRSAGGGCTRARVRTAPSGSSSRSSPALRDLRRAAPDHTTPTEPGIYEHKYYARGLGLIAEIKVGEDETVKLVEASLP
jgi:hypothetical protein